MALSADAKTRLKYALNNETDATEVADMLDAAVHTGTADQTTAGIQIHSTVTDATPAPIIRFGKASNPIQFKVHGRPNDLSTLEVRSRTTKASALTGMGIDSECEIRPATTATAGYARGTMGVCRIQTGKTLAGTSYVAGLWGSWRADGTVNGDVFASAITGVIGDGGTYTAVNHLAVLWLDTQLTRTVTSGKTSFIYMTNNGGIEYDNAIYIYGGTAAQGITNLLNLDTCTDSGLVSNGGTVGTHGTATKKIRISIDGVEYWLLASTTPTFT